MLKYKKINSCICSILFLFLSSKNQNLKLFRYILPVFFLSLSIVATAQPPIKDGAILAEFSVGDSTKVYFSQGNLQYNVKNKLWRFAEQQYSMLNSPFSWDVRKTNVEWCDIFNSEQSGYKLKEEINEKNLRLCDWGWYNRVSNGGNERFVWRTLYRSEMNYLLYMRKNADSLRAWALVGDIHGLILLPDKWKFIEDIDFIPSSQPDDTILNVYSFDQWSIMEQQGAVFFPVASYPFKTFYWLVSLNITEYAPCLLEYNHRLWYEKLYTNYIKLRCKDTYWGYVRLVKDISDIYVSIRYRHYKQMAWDMGRYTDCAYYPDADSFRVQVLKRNKFVCDTTFKAFNNRFTIPRSFFEKYSTNGILTAKISDGSYSEKCDIYGDGRDNSFVIKNIDSKVYENLYYFKNDNFYRPEVWTPCIDIIIDNDKNVYQYYVSIDDDLFNSSYLTDIARVYKDKNNKLLIRLDEYGLKKTIVINLRERADGEWMKIYVHVVSNGKERVEIEQRDGERVDVYVSPDRIFLFPKDYGFEFKEIPYVAPDIPSSLKTDEHGGKINYEADGFKSLKEW